MLTQYHRAANRIREANREAKHGTCGLGIGEARREELAGENVLRMYHLGFSASELASLLRATRARLFDSLADVDWSLDEESEILMNESPEHVASRLMAIRQRLRVQGDSILLRALQNDKPIIFEGAQGVLLDEKHGYKPPHVTWTDCTFGNAYSVLNAQGTAAKGVEIEKWGVTRTYLTRHGLGPMPVEGLNSSFRVREEHNTEDGWQGSFRVGPLDRKLLWEASRSILGGVDYVSLTHVDQAPKPMVVMDLVEGATTSRVKLLSFGPSAREKFERRV
jgi:adenylosuccinate synthase